MKTLLAGGCSFTLGNELSDHLHEFAVSQLTWSALLAKELGMKYRCVAKPGASNQTIVRLIIDSIIDSPADAVVIMWSFTSRYEYHDRRIKDFKQVSAELSRRDPMVEKYYDVCGDDEVQEVHTSLTSFLLMQEFLNNRKIPYIFTIADINPLTRFPALRPNKSVASLISAIDWSKWHWVDPKSADGFFNWGRKNYPCGSEMHPLELAHFQLFDSMRPKALTWFNN